MLLRIGVMLTVTGLAFIGMTWLEPIGPLLVILGAFCAAVTLEARLELEAMEWEPVTREVAADASDKHRAA